MLVAAARGRHHAGPQFLVGDLAELDLPAAGIPDPFDAIVCAGNVMTFLAPSTRREVLRRLRRTACAPDGRAAIGFGAGRGYEFDEFLADAAAVGLGARPAAVHLGPAAVHPGVGLPGRDPSTWWMSSFNWAISARSAASPALVSVIHVRARLPA